MKIIILHHDLEWTEQEIEKIIQNKFNGEVHKFDIRNTSIEEIKKTNPTLILNRVYASVANRDFESLKKNLNLLKELEKQGFLIINSLETSKSDYSKNYAFQQMQKNQISTPKTIVFSKKLDISQTIKELGGFPVIIKRDSGGRGKDLQKCESIEEIFQAVNQIKNSPEYYGEIIIQEFIVPKTDYDYRVWVIGGNIIFHHTRNLISQKENEKPWLASRSLGSNIQIKKQELPQEIIELAKKASKSIKADFNVLDIMESEKGFVVIENNPTPNLRPEYQEIIGFDPVEFLIEQIIKNNNLN